MSPSVTSFQYLSRLPFSCCFCSDTFVSSTILVIRCGGKKRLKKSIGSFVVSRLWIPPEVPMNGFTVTLKKFSVHWKSKFSWVDLLDLGLAWPKSSSFSSLSSSDESKSVSLTSTSLSILLESSPLSLSMGFSSSSASFWVSVTSRIMLRSAEKPLFLLWF